MLGNQLNFNRHSKVNTPIILTEDMTVWKIGKIEDNIFTSRYTKYQYHPNELVKSIELKPYRDSDGLRYVAEGYHAFINKELAEMFVKTYPKIEHETIGEFLIPAGSTVYKECFGKHLVASTIKFIK